jgi:hypothetical protein
VIRRRSFVVAAVATAALGQRVHAAEDDARLSKRLELWGTYASRTDNLVARVLTERRSALLQTPLVRAGTLLFRGPDALLLSDDDTGGSTTLVQRDQIAIRPRAAHLQARAIAPQRVRPELRWLAHHLLALFGADGPEALLRDSRGRAGNEAHRFELRPPRGTRARKATRSVAVKLDPVGGAILRLEIAEAQGDEISLALSDHRQNLPAEELDRLWLRASQPM